MARITHVLSVLCLLPTVSLCLQNFSFPDDKSRTLISPSSAIKEVDGIDILALDGRRTSSGVAFYNQSMEFDQSFASFFYISTSDGPNGTLAFVLVPSDDAADLSKARETLSIEFNSSACSDAEDANYWQSGIQVSAYANKSSPLTEEDSHHFHCFWPNSSQYEILVAYNATTKTVFVATPHIHPQYYSSDYYNFMSFTLHLSLINSAKPLYVGFIVSSGSYYNLSQWNLTAINSSTGYLATILQQQQPGDTESNPDPTNSPYSDPTAPAGGSGSGSYKLSTGYVVTFSVLGAAIVVALVIGVWLLFSRTPAPRRSSAAARRVHSNPPQNAAFFDNAKFQPRPPPPSAHNLNNTPMNLGSERDTAPLNPPSAFQVSTTASSWLKPVTTR